MIEEGYTEAVLIVLDLLEKKVLYVMITSNLVRFHII